MSRGFTIRVEVDGAQATSEMLASVARMLENPAPLHAQMASEAEQALKTQIASIQSHRTANALGAPPTGHLAEQAEKIEGQSDAEAARVMVPSAGRLSAAFGPVHVQAQPGKALAIPMAAESYGHQPMEFPDLFLLTREKQNKPPLLARHGEDGHPQVLYVLLKSVDIPEDPTLINFPALAELMGAVVEAYLLDAPETRNTAA